MHTQDNAIMLSEEAQKQRSSVWARDKAIINIRLSFTAGELREKTRRRTDAELALLLLSVSKNWSAHFLGAVSHLICMALLLKLLMCWFIFMTMIISPFALCGL